MDKELYARIRALLPRLLPLSPAERAALLDAECGDDDNLRREIVDLLAHEDSVAGLAGTAGPVLDPDLAGAAFAGADRDAAPPDAIGPYAIGEELGRGGMGVVYRAEQTAPLRRTVALKIIKRGMDTDAVVARFRTERQALALMNHPHVAQVLDAGATDDGRPYYVMEYVDGEPITRFCDRAQATPGQRLDLFLQVCGAVQHAHQRGIIHRDLKPSNVLAQATPEGDRTKVIDFGIAKAVSDPLTGGTLMTQSGQILGTPEYMSPEQAGIIDHPIDTRTDVYCLGALLYELLSGRTPYRFDSYGFGDIRKVFRDHDPSRPSTAVTEHDGPTGGAGGAQSGGGTTTAEEISRLRGRSVERLRKELQGDLDNIVLMAMHKDPERRYPSVDALAEDIRRYRSQLPVRARPDSWTYRANKFIRRNALGVTLFVVISILLTALLLNTLVQSQRVERQRDRAVRAETQARTEAAAAREVSDFLAELFLVNDPGEARGNTITAREILDQGAERIRQELGEQPVVRARLMNTIGAVYQNLGLYAEADTLVDEALRIRRETLGDDAPDVAESLLQKSWLVRDEGRPEEALPLARRALEIRQAAYGPEHKLINEAMYHVASTTEELGDLETAIPLFREVLRLDRKLLGDADPQVPESMNNLAVALAAYGEMDEAEQLYRESLRLNREILGTDHPEVATSAANLANLLFQSGKRDEGLALAEEALEIRTRVLGRDHPHTAIAAGNLGIKYYGLKRYDDAERLLRESLRVKQASNGPRHPSTAHAWILLGLSQLGREDAKAAEESFGEALSIYRETMPPGHNNTARALHGLGGALMQQGRYDEAEPLLVEALTIRREALPAGHREIAESLQRLGEFRLETGDLAAAEALLSECWESQRGDDGPLNTRARKAARTLARVYVALGDSARAQEYRDLGRNPDE
ncbi:serine/threonine protein kinase [bacterium]|nr:serine/threonine protein kinase [bacterium]